MDQIGIKKYQSTQNFMLNSNLSQKFRIPKKTIFLKKFKNGPFRLSLEKNLKIVPITLIDNKQIFPQEYFKGYPSFARVTIHKPIDPNKLQEKDVKNLNIIVYNTIFEQLKKYEKN